MGHTFCQSQSRREIRKKISAHLNNLHVISSSNLLVPTVVTFVLGPHFHSRVRPHTYTHIHASNVEKQNEFRNISVSENLKFHWGLLRLENSNVAHVVKTSISSI